jgi:tetratricopeptide (TPR) repeat protein
MAINPYASCPCGSGKKFKFCCQDVLADLQRINGLSRNQPEVALAQARQLAAKHPDRESVLRELVVNLLRFRLVDEALQACAQFLKAHPDNPVALLIYADISIQRAGFDASRRIVHRAFQVCTRQFPKEIGEILARIGVEMLDRNLVQAAREHLVLAIRLQGTDQPSVAVNAARALESSAATPYILRTNWSLMNFDAPPEALQQHERALRLCRLGCWEPASIIYNRLADQLPTNSIVWYNLGLCQMWDGRETEASASLHHAAMLSQDFELAAEAEALSQVLNPRNLEDSLAIVNTRLNVRAVSELVERLKSRPEIIELPGHDHSECNHFPGTHHAAELSLVSGPVLPDAEVTPENFLYQLADVDVFDISNEQDAATANIQHPFIDITCSSENADHVLVSLRDYVGDLIVSGIDDEKRTVIRRYPRFTKSLESRPVDPKPGSVARSRSLFAKHHQDCIEKYLAEPQPLLNGKSLVDAAQDPELKKQAAGAVYLMQAYALTADIQVDVDEIRTRIGLPSRTPLPAKEVPHPALVSALSCSRVPAGEISDEHLPVIAHRFLQIGIRSQVIPVVDEMIRRGPSVAGEHPEFPFLCRSSIARSESQTELCFSLLEQARNAVGDRPDAFRIRLELDIRELAWRLDEPEDPQIRPLLHRLRDQYLHKIPELHNLLREQLENADCSHLLPEIDVPATPAASPSSTLWTPGSQTPNPTKGSLWIPGQS